MISLISWIDRIVSRCKRRAIRTRERPRHVRRGRRGRRSHAAQRL